MPDKRSMPEPPKAANVPSGMAAAGKVENNLHKLPADEDNSARHTSADIEVAVKNANHFLEQISRELRFERSETDGKIVVQVKDQKTGSVIRQFPSEEMLQIAKDMEKMTGLLFKDSA